MTKSYAHLGVYSDWVQVSRGPRTRATRPTSEQVRVMVRDALSVPSQDTDPGAADGELPTDVRLERRWTADGPEPTPPALTALRSSHYEGRAFANDLARAGSPYSSPTSSAGAAAASRSTRCLPCCNTSAKRLEGLPRQTPCRVRCPAR